MRKRERFNQTDRLTTDGRMSLSFSRAKFNFAE